MDANRTTLAFHEETTWGTTPACAFTKIRFTGESLNFNISNITSNEIRSDRQVMDLIQTGADAGGGLNFELSYGALDVLLRGAFSSDWTGIGAANAETITAGTTTSSISTDGAAKTITLGAALTHAIVPGIVIKLEGFGADSGYKFVTNVAGQVITVDSMTLTTSYSTSATTIKGGYMMNGTTKRSYSVERKVDMPTGADYFFVYRGMMVNNLSLAVSSGAVVTGSLDFIGKDSSANTVSYATGAYVEAPTNNVLNAVSNVGQIMEGSTLAQIAGVYFREISFQLGNNLRGRPAIGVLGNFDVGQGKVDVTGSVTAYFANKNLYDKYVAATETGLAFKVKEGANATVAGKGYFFVFPRIKFSSDAVNAEGTDTDITEKLNWTAIRHATYGYTAVVCRYAS